MPLLVLPVLGLLVWFVVRFFQHRSARRAAEASLANTTRTLAEVNQQYAALHAAYVTVQQHVAALARYQPILDVDAHVAQLRATAEQQWNATQAFIERKHVEATAERDAILASAHDEARATAMRVQQSQVEAAAGKEAILEAARDEARRHVNAAEQVRAQAANEKEAILARAHDEARQIAGEAFDALNRKKELELTIRALQNTIDGYGLEYLIPSHTLLDELGSQYEFAQAGSQLKAAIARVKAMVRAGQAATCDYVEANRRLTAIAFAVDAFNGKVDTALSSVKHDNFGVLYQQIRDGFQLVNHLGEAFRNARIEPKYLDAQLDVLRWAMRVQEIKVREREEQRALREQMREEAKAAKEYERALKEAAKDEETARRAVEKALTDLAKVESEAQRAKLEAKLTELTDRLRVAEEKGQRALSMAQQTKAGHVYVISNVGSFGEDVLKIGMTRRLEPLDRVKELGDASVPFEFDVHAMIRCEDAPALERELQRAFLDCQVNKVNARKEFFRVGLAKVKAAVEERGLQTAWTIAAEAREWRESLALEERLRTDAGARAEWERGQIAAQHRQDAAESGELAEESLQVAFA